MPGVCSGEVDDPGQGGHQQQHATADGDLRTYIYIIYCNLGK